MAANERQVGGNHYKGDAVEPWDYIDQHNLDFFCGNVVKYVTRFSKTGAAGDLEKAKHYLEKRLELMRGVVGEVDDKRKASYSHINFMDCSCPVCREFKTPYTTNKRGDTNNNA